MAVAYVDSSSAGSAGAVTSYSLTRPALAASGHLAIIVLGCALNDTTITPPGGWTQLNAPTTQGTTLTFFSYYRVLDASDTPGTTYTFTAASRTFAGGISCYSGQGASWSDGLAVQGNTSSANITIPAITTAVDNDVIVAGYAASTGTTASTSTPPSSPAFTERFDVSSSAGGQRPTALSDWTSGAHGTMGPYTAVVTTAGISVATNAGIAPQSDVTPPAAPTGLTATAMTQ